MYRDAFPDKLDHLLSCARIVAPLIPEISGAKAQVESLQRELATLSSQIDRDRKTLATEKASREVEHRTAKEASSLATTGRELDLADLAKQITDKRNEAIRVQNALAAEQRKLEDLAKQIRQIERRYPGIGEA